MLSLLQGHLPFLVGAVLAIVLIGVRASSADKTLRNDLRGAIWFLLSFFATRLLGLWLAPWLSPSVTKAVTVTWMLLFAFGVIRSGVSIGLWVLRLGSRPTPKILRDVIDFLAYAFTAVPILKHQLDIDLTGLVATSAILSVVIGLALQDTLGNLFAGLSIQLERPFQVGDFVTIGEHTGRVVQVAWRATRLETFRRESITLPNSILSKQPVKNFSREPTVGADLFLNLAFGVAPNRVKDAIAEVLQDVPFVLPEPPVTVKTWAYDDSHVRYRARFFVSDFAHVDRVTDEFHSRIWYRFRRDGIDFPSSQKMVNVRSVEDAKPDLPAETLAQLLQTVDLFSLLRPEDRERLGRELTPRRFGRGERILEEGEVGNTFYVVAAGEVAVKAGQPQVEVTRLKRGQYFGEMSLLTGEPRAATVIAGSDVLLLEVDRPTFARLFAEHPGLARQLSALLAQRRGQLRAAAEAVNGAADPAPEAGHIFGRLRQIFGLKHD